MTAGDRSPCLIAAARHTWHPADGPAPEPLDMWEHVVRALPGDAGISSRAVEQVDDLNLVHCQSWAYDRPVERLAERLGLHPANRSESILAGTSPQRLLNLAAERMLRGETRAALVVGGEALATRRVADRGGAIPPWSHPHPSPPALPVDLDEWYLPTEIAHGILPAWLTFALLEQARWAARGGTAEQRMELYEVLDRINAVAVDNPDAWFRERHRADDLATPDAGNRMVATPYTKHMTAFMDVDMAAASLMVTRELADQLGVPEDRRVHLRGWGFARDSVHLGARHDLTRSPAMAAATGGALAMAGLGVDDLSCFDLYSCFGSAVQFALDALGLAHDDPRPLSVTGGLPYHGGPSSNYMGHSISHLADRLRTRPDEVGLVTGIGMHMTKHVAAVWSVRPGPIIRTGGTEQPQRWGADPADTGDVTVRDAADGPARVLAASVVHGRDGAADHGVAVCELPGGDRCYARTSEPDTLAALGADAWVGANAELRSRPDRTNDLRLG